MSRDHTQLMTIAVLLVAVGIMAYGWGRDHERASDYRELMGQYRDTVHAMEDRYNAAQDTIDALAYRLEQRAQEQAAIQQDRRNETTRYYHERETLDTAGAAYLGRVVIWANYHQ